MQRRATVTNYAGLINHAIAHASAAGGTATALDQKRIVGYAGRALLFMSAVRNHGYMKDCIQVLNHQKDDRLDPAADDVATLDCDVLLLTNPFLIGH